MKPLQHLHLDFIQPQRALAGLRRAAMWALVVFVASVVVVVMLTREARELQSQLQPHSDQGATADTPPDLPAPHSTLIRWLNNDLAFLQQSVERTLPAGVVLMTLTASQDSGDVTLTVQAASAEKILALPAWLEPNAAQRRWKVEQVSLRAGSNGALVGVLSCTKCWGVAR